MATSIATQTLLGAFFFGILLQTALGALLIHCKGHEGSIFQDGRRLVLLLFLLFSALWALTDFINLNITSSSTSCQVALAFSTSSDQLARVGIEQFLLWSVGHGAKLTVSQLMLQSILGVRFIVGAVLVGITRPDFAPVCVARTSVLPIAIVVLSLDAIIIAMLTARSLSIGMPRKEQNKGLMLVATGFALWTGTSAAMLLGIHSISLIVKTALPSVGLLILIVIVAISADSLISPREGAVIPEVTSPFINHSAPFGEETRENFEDRTTRTGRGHTAAGNQFVVNQHTAPRTLPTGESQGKYLARGKAFMSSERDERMNSTERNMLSYNTDSTESNNQTRREVTSLAFFEGRSTTLYQGATVPQVGFISGMERGLPLPAQAPRTLQEKKSLFKWSKSAPQPTVRSMGISNPVVINSDSPSQPFARIKTIDLATAASNDKERREDAAARVRLTPNRPAPHPPQHSMDAALRKSVSIKRKEMPTRRSELMAAIPNSAGPQLLVGIASGSTTSASLSPGHENIRQRSPRSMNAFGEAADEMVPRQQTLQRKPTFGLPSNPKSKMVAITRVPTVGKGSAAVPAGSKPKPADEIQESAYASELKSSGSILHRPRPYRRDSEKDRALFPTGKYLQHRRSKSGSSIVEARNSIFESHPGSPTKLPYLPTLPTRASELAHILSSNNKNMTFDEKIQFLFPAPPMSTLTNSRRSSVPSLPRIPSVYMSNTSPLQSPADDDRKSSGESKRSRVASFETIDIWSFGASLAEADTRNPPQEPPFQNSNELPAVTLIPHEATSTSRTIVNVDQSSPTRNAKIMNPQPKDAREPKVDVSTWSTSDGAKETFFLDANQDLPGDKTPSPKHMPAWHRRIGDELPTFSERRKNSKARKMPPPTPLLLNRKGNSVSVVVHSPAPSPVDSPGKAMKVLQAQLKHFEEPNKNSLDAPLRRVPATKPAAVVIAVDNRDSRTELLQELELEMGQQESLWQNMQSNFDYDSNSIILTPQPPTPPVEVSPQETLQQPASHPGRNRNSMTRSGTSSTSSSRTSSNNRASEWQQRLVEAQMEYLDNIPTLNRNRNLNFLSISQSQIGSPTPPDSVDSETDIESGSEPDLEFSSSEGGNDMALYHKPSMWQQRDPTFPKTAVNGLWNPVSTPPHHTVSQQAPEKDMRLRKRFIQEVLPVFSSVLWSKPSSSLKVTYTGLWSSRKDQPKSISIRRVSERPQRKSKRIGYLPDIVESPQPLPHKRDTLGIFQFPSGETSDSAFRPSVFSPSLRTNAALDNPLSEIKSGKSGSDPSEYSSSFFDDYDELDGYEDADSDDDFDESTLWEISNLLVSKDMASNETSLPLANVRKEIFEVYDDEICFQMVSAREDTASDMPVESPKVIHDPFFDLPIRPLTLSATDRPKLWTNTSLTPLNIPTKGLPQPDLRTWESYVSKSRSEIRSRPHHSRTLSVLTTSGLWENTHVEQLNPMSTSLCRPSEAPKERQFNLLRTSVMQSNLLWESQAEKSEQQLSEYIATDAQSSNLTAAKVPLLWAPLTDVEARPAPMFVNADHHTDNSFPTRVTTVRNAGLSQIPLDRLMSSQLWTEQQVLESKHHWISESSVRPNSPSIQSGSSSGYSSPTSDAVSVTSSSTKTSSLWGSLKSIGTSSWSAKTSKNSASTTYTDDKESSLTLVPQPVPRSLVSKRESQVLAFRDLFESRATGSELSLNRTSLEYPASSKAIPQDHKVPLNNPHDVATHQSVSFNQGLMSPIEDMHPAAISDIKRSTDTNNESYNTTVNDSTPSPHASEALMWTSSPVKAESTDNFELLWSKDSNMQISNLFEHISNETTRRPTVFKSLRLPVLESSGLWKEANVVNSNNNWLASANLTQPQMWSALPKTVQNKSITLMTVAKNSPQNLFSHIKEDRPRKVTSRALPLPTLNSSQLFESGISVPDSPLHWLHSTSRVTELPSHSMTWTRPVNAAITEPESSGMWKLRDIATIPSPTLFSNPHDAPWIKKKKGTMSTQQITSSELWRSSASLPAKPNHWLVDRRSSRVQFRY